MKTTGICSALGVLRSAIPAILVAIVLCSTAQRAQAQLGDPDLTTLQTLRDQYGWGAAFGWASNTNPCPLTGANWTGVTCESGRVVIIVAICQTQQLNQPIPPVLAQLTAITSLDIRNCGLTGTVPDWLATLPLTRLRLDNNALTGSIP